MAFVESCRSLIRALTLHDKEILKMNDECEFMLEYLLRQLDQLVIESETLNRDISTEVNTDLVGSIPVDAVETNSQPNRKSKRKVALLSS